ncbi:glycoside hydrolase family 2 protein [Brevundimonas sp.]|uniref:glycoside hydrolase family 2 protein n=1 Tax=Brevundimonas sp. TaxID=1871086 RepID=UPI002D481054|nr:glycoside hydrolase family 2 TIM barrel-domain containing protein [Brevundimonas sp.]HYC97205.1 glycoside hydrolase family 2 TIM barrel-domain containing protein [Brevundimonas sp.]
MNRLARMFVLVAAVFGLAGAGPAAADPRMILPLDDGWRFIKGDPAGASGTVVDDASWSAVRLPHTWNGVDGEDGGGGYYRGPGWYRTTFSAPVSGGGRTWLEFDGAALAADAWVNGVHVGRHEGGYARFRFDVTEALRPGVNQLAVRVDNSRAETIAPLGGDFTVFGGLYRPARLVTVGSVHLDMADYGGPGVYLTASNVSEAGAEIALLARVANDGETPAAVVVRTTLTDADGAVALVIETPVAAPPGQTVTVRDTARLPRPRLWDGKADPHLYRLTAEVLDARGEAIDRLVLTTGIRTAAIDPDRGFILNGRPVPLRGVNYFHAGRPGRGLAVQEAEIDADFAILEELGGTGVRFVHFQHPQRAYDLADRTGLVVWTEVPLNSAASPSPAFAANLTQQMRELIRQNHHHPSVAVWGLGNEVYATDDVADQAIALMQAVAKEEDPTRSTAYAHCCQDDLDRKALHADLTAYNRYYGWYDETFARIGPWADERRARDPSRPMGVGEFGAGASVLHQQNPPDRPTPDGDWHPEQYQTAFHEAYWTALRERAWLWGSFIWVGFDLASDGRDEGDRPGINDKGLVTYDRAVRKDAWYWYQAHWSDRPMVHILDRRLTRDAAPVAGVRAYSNVASLELFINGRSAGVAPVVDHVATWSAVAMPAGLNRIEVRGPGGLTDTVWKTRVEPTPVPVGPTLP